MDLNIRHEVLWLALGDPFVIACSEHGADSEVMSVGLKPRDDPHTGAVGRLDLDGSLLPAEDLFEGRRLSQAAGLGVRRRSANPISAR